ncbi:MAG: YceI family protein [Planctomycetota bacterium]
MAESDSSVTFRVDKKGNPVNGRFEALNGSFTPPTADTSGKIYAAVAVASVDTDNRRRDGKIKGKGWFEADAHPLVAFDGKVTAKPNTDAELLAEGVITMLGVQQPLTATLTPQTNSQGVTAYRTSFSVKRSDFGFTAGVANGSVGDQVDLEVELAWQAEATN